MANCLICELETPRLRSPSASRSTSSTGRFASRATAPAAARSPGDRASRDRRSTTAAPSRAGHRARRTTPAPRGGHSADRAEAAFRLGHEGRLRHVPDPHAVERGCVGTPARPGRPRLRDPGRPPRRPWHTLLGIDLVGSIRSRRSVPLDDALPHVLQNPRARRIEGLDDNLWLRPHRPGVLLGVRTYGTEDRLVLEVTSDAIDAPSTRSEVEGGPTARPRPARDGGPICRWTGPRSAPSPSGGPPLAAGAARRIGENTGGAAGGGRVLRRR